MFYMTGRGSLYGRRSTEEIDGVGGSQDVFILLMLNHSYFISNISPLELEATRMSPYGQGPGCSNQAVAYSACMVSSHMIWAKHKLEDA